MARGYLPLPQNAFTEKLLRQPVKKGLHQKTLTQPLIILCVRKTFLQFDKLQRIDLISIGKQDEHICAALKIAYIYLFRSLGGSRGHFL